jgi:hypothetical protein
MPADAYWTAPPPARPNAGYLAGSRRGGAYTEWPSFNSYFWSLLLSLPAAGGYSSILASNGAALSNSRSTPAFVDLLGNGTSMLLAGPLTLRIEPNGLRQENAATNLLYYSNLIGYNDGTNGWLLSNTGTSNPVITTNSADLLAPDGTQTASKIVIPACTTAQASFVYQSPGGLNTRSVWLRTLSGTASVQLTSSAATGAVTCAVTTTWQRFTMSDAVGVARFTLGYDGSETGGTFSGPGCTVYAWGAQAESTAFPTSYFPTNTNVLLNTSTVGVAGWDLLHGGTSPASPVCTGNTTDVTDPMGGNTATKTVFANALLLGDYCFIDQAMGGFDNGLNSVWLRTLSGTATVYQYCYGSGPTLTCNVTSTWQKFSIQSTVGQTYYILGGDNRGGSQPMSACTVYVWGPQVEKGTQPSSTFITGATLTTTRSRDQHTVANPLFGLDPTNNWSFGATLTPLSTWNNLNTADTGLGAFLIFGGQSTANSARALISGANLEFDVWDGTAAVLTKYANSTLVGSTPISPSFFDQSGVLTITPPATPSSAGTGTGVITTQPATLTLGYTADPYSLIGWISNLWINNK